MTNKKTPSKKFDNEQYKYDPSNGEELLIDKSPIPLSKIDIQEEEKIIESKIKIKKDIKSNGQIYEAYIKDIKNYKLLYNGKIIYDSTLSKNATILSFESDYFILFGKKYSYNGLRIQKI